MKLMGTEKKSLEDIFNDDFNEKGRIEKIHSEVKPMLESINYDIYNLMGDRNKDIRQKLMTSITGNKVPKAKCGVTHLKKAIGDLINLNLSNFICYSHINLIKASFDGIVKMPPEEDLSSAFEVRFKVKIDERDRYNKWVYIDVSEAKTSQQFRDACILSSTYSGVFG